MYNEACGLPEVEPSAILGLAGSNQFMLYPLLLNGCVILFMVVPLVPFLPKIYTHTHPVNCPNSLPHGLFPFFVLNFTEAC